MKPSTQRAVSVILAAALVVGGFLIFAVLVNPAYQDIQQLRGELAAKSQLFQTQSEQFTQVQNLIAQFQGVTRLQESLSLALPQKEEVAEVVNQINFLAQASGVFINSAGLNIQPLKKEIRPVLVKGLGTARLSLKLVGSYAAFKSFLQNLETNIRLMDLADLKITLAGKPNEDSHFYALTVDTYYQLK